MEFVEMMKETLHRYKEISPKEKKAYWEKVATFLQTTFPVQEDRSPFSGIPLSELDRQRCDDRRHIMLISRFIKGTIPVLLLISTPYVLQAQTQHADTRNLAHEDQQLIDARRANEEAQAAYYREQLAKLRE